MAEFVKDQVANASRQIAANKFEKARTEITINKKGVFVQRAHVDGALQKLVPHSFRQRILALSHHLSSSVHSVPRRMYDKMQRDYFCPNTTTNIYSTFISCKSCAKNGSNAKYRFHHHLFLATSSLEHVAMNFIGPLPKTTEANQHVASIIYPHSKLRQAVLTAHITTDTLTKIFFNAWFISYGIPAYLLTDNGS